jgi:hypothetical protein
MRLLCCLALFGVAMLGVKYAANGVFNSFGMVGIIVTLALMYGAARWHDHRAGVR